MKTRPEATLWHTFSDRLERLSVERQGKHDEWFCVFRGKVLYELVLDSCWTLGGSWLNRIASRQSRHCLERWFWRFVRI